MSQVQRVETKGAASMSPVVMDQGTGYRAEIFETKENIHPQVATPAVEPVMPRRRRRKAAPKKLCFDFPPDMGYVIWKALDAVHENLSWRPDEEQYQENYTNWMIGFPREEKMFLSYAIVKLDSPLLPHQSASVELTPNEWLVLKSVLEAVKENLGWNENVNEYTDDYTSWMLTLSRGEYRTLARLLNKV